jgi:hypothetical protein
MRTTRDTDRSAHRLAGPTILDDLDRNDGVRATLVHTCRHRLGFRRRPRDGEAD